MAAIELGSKWLEEVLSIISLKDEVHHIQKARLTVMDKLRRMGKAYVDGLFPDGEYYRQKKLLELELESLVIPQANATDYVNGKKTRLIVAIKPKPPFIPIFQVALLNRDLLFVLSTSLSELSPEARPCF